MAKEAQAAARKLRIFKLPVTEGPIDAPSIENLSPVVSNQMTRTPGPNSQEAIPMKAIVVTDRAAGTGGMKLAERPAPPAAINDVMVQIHASGFVPTEMEWPWTWTDRRDRDRTPSIPGHELAGVVSDTARRDCR
jgi:hypothetical protein